jgi:hypothetical protein
MREIDIENIINFENQNNPLTDPLNDLNSINIIRKVAKILFEKFKEEMRKCYDVEPETRMTFDKWFEKEYEN